MKNELNNNHLVSGPRLLDLLFEEESRPSLRWLREQQKRRIVPYLKIGARVYFDPVQVRESLNKNNLIKPRCE